MFSRVTINVIIPVKSVSASLNRNSGTKQFALFGSFCGRCACVGGEGLGLVSQAGFRSNRGLIVQHLS